MDLKSDMFSRLKIFVKFVFFPLSQSFLESFFPMSSFLQGVHSMLDGCPGKKWEEDEKRINKLVFIGRNLDESALKKGFNGCLV